MTERRCAASTSSWDADSIGVPAASKLPLCRQTVQCCKHTVPEVYCRFVLLSTGRQRYTHLGQVLAILVVGVLHDAATAVGLGSGGDG